jgi:DNA-3-methyladenine glycosylase
MLALSSGAVSVAKNLLGMKLVTDLPAGITSGFIVETEAYKMNDPASHTFRGETIRNSAMFQEAGTLYVYFTYGRHYCVNIVTGPVGRGEAVLIRALEPVDGIELMKQRRGTDSSQLTNGPAKLAQALGIKRSLNGTNIFDGPLKMENGVRYSEIVQARRIGITKAVDKPWRFYAKNNSFVSKI